MRTPPDRSTPSSAVEVLCPLCRVAMHAKYAGIGAEETGEWFDIVECPGCGLGRTRPIPDDLGPYYSPPYYGGRHGWTARWCLRRRLGVMRRHAGPGAGRVLLDFGCGDGEFLRGARRLGWTCRGIERARPGPTPTDLEVVASLDDLGRGEAIDCATFWHVLEHLEDPVGLLRDLRGRMKPGGLVLAAVPNFGSWQARATGPGWLHLDAPRHLSHFTAEALSRTFRSGGFRVEAVGGGELEYDLIGWSQGLLNRRLGGRNEFFKAVSGRPGRRLTGVERFQVVAGLALTLLAVLPTWAERRLGRSGTLIVAARVDPRG